AGPSGPSLEVMVYAEPAPLISGDELVCKNDNGVYSVEYSEYSQYSWTVDGGNIVEGDETNEITVYWTADQGSTTHVDLTETKTEGCETIAETFDVAIDQCVGVDENTFEYVKFYPNPAKNKINVELSNIFYKFVEFRLIDIQGKVVYSNRVEISDGVYSGNIGLGSIPEGLYLFTAKSDDNLFFAKKVMVIK
ncbi:MAG: T9SS type A sorting domain-containing protein, partial [Chlorobi bacterium]|nr:T9SS type A sorting domain-containing protein [Chlorobiota bacterium]